MAQRVIKEKPTGRYFVVYGQPYLKDVICFIGANKALVDAACYRYRLTKDEYKDFMESFGNEEEGFERIEGGGAINIGISTGKQAVFFSSKIKNNPNGIAMVCHEMFHATCRIMTRSGMGELTGSNEEAWAYLQDSLVTQFWQQLKK